MVNLLKNTKVCVPPKAFTLAEVLITLGVIGVVAALTLPALINKYQKVVIKNRFKKAYSLVSQAIKQVEVNNGAPLECYIWPESRGVWNIQKKEIVSNGSILILMFMEQILNVQNSCRNLKRL